MSVVTEKSSTWMLTGGAGYIGSHIVRALRAEGLSVAVIDDLSSGDAARVPADVPFYRLNVSDQAAVTDVLRRHNVDGVIHLAARKSVEESMQDPLLYWRANAEGTRAVLAAATEAGVRAFIFSSSSSVYGDARGPRVAEGAPLSPISPYGQTKLAGEQMVEGAGRAYGMRWISLRYFNVAGTAEAGLVETHPMTLVPRVLGRLAQGKTPTVNGVGYPTPDGSCVRDYIHVADVAEAHLRAALLVRSTAVNRAINIGTGSGASVREIFDVARQVTGIDFVEEVGPVRPGDPPYVVADVTLSQVVLGWAAHRSVSEMVASEWRSRTILTRQGAPS